MSTWVPLAENAVRLETPNARKIARVLQNQLPNGIVETIACGTEITVLFDPLIYGYADVSAMLAAHAYDELTEEEGKVVEIPICYELGLDWNEVITRTGLSREEIITRHTAGSYRAHYGFMPGFLYLSGLDETLHCPRKSTPRTRIPKGAVGIGGNQTGIYSLESPGGWQIIGLSPLSFFNPSLECSFLVPDGATVHFRAISKTAFEAYVGP